MRGAAASIVHTLPSEERQVATPEADTEDAATFTPIESSNTVLSLEADLDAESDPADALTDTSTVAELLPASRVVLPPTGAVDTNATAELQTRSAKAASGTIEDSPCSQPGMTPRGTVVAPTATVSAPLGDHLEIAPVSAHRKKPSKHEHIANRLEALLQRGN